MFASFRSLHFGMMVSSLRIRIIRYCGLPKFMVGTDGDIFPVPFLGNTLYNCSLMAQCSSAYNLGKAFGANRNLKVEKLPDIEDTGVARLSENPPVHLSAA